MRQPGRFAVIGSQSRLGLTGDMVGGVQGLLGLDYAGDRWSTSFQVQAATHTFRQLGLDLLTQPDKRQIFANFNYALPDTTSSLGFSFASIARFDLTKVTTLSANYSHKIGKSSRLNWNLSRSSSSLGGTSVSLGVVLTIALDNDIQWNTGLRLRNWRPARCWCQQRFC